MRHFEVQLDELRKRLLEMGGLVESAIHRSVVALTRKDEEEARLVLVNEARVNQLEIEIDDFTISLFATEQPVAGDLRFLTSAIKINNDLERMGDLAVNIVERALSLTRAPEVRPPVDLPEMAMLAESMVHKCLDAFVRRDSDLARTVLASDDSVDRLRTRIYQQLTEFMQKDPSSIPQCIDLIFVARNLERIADHATNVAEDVLFLVQGVDVRHHAEAKQKP